ncbi:MAG: hypothetical protein K9H13_06190 [Bacteroidales bacterium]|nr:hypothetical protein [Bacteroidales bacterium]MCF8352696.1 hypothetical protein [Bacteroidales bacterium]MCF8399988.1 hypothetical protein [Bacteroidales bacterium]
MNKPIFLFSLLLISLSILDQNPRGTYIENQIIVFLIEDSNENMLKLKLLETGFEPGKNMIKGLNKLEKKAQNTDMRLRTYVRE